MAQAAVASVIPAAAGAQQRQQGEQVYRQALVTQLSRGASPEAAAARALQAVQAQRPAPPSTPAAAAAQSLASADPDPAADVGGDSTPKGGAGGKAFDQALSAAMARGQPVARALAAAQNAAQAAEAAARADARPQAQLALADSAAIQALGALPKAAQLALGQLLGRGLSAEQALARAQAQAEQAQRWDQLDAGRPAGQLSQGQLPPAASPETASDFDRALSVALLRGGSPEAAVARARDTERRAQQAQRRDAAHPWLSLSQQGREGQSPTGDPRVLASALARGLTPEEALRRASMTPAEPVKAKGPLSTRLSSDTLDPALLQAELEGSRAFRMSFEAGIRRGSTPEQALAQARRTEREQMWRQPLSSAVAARVGVAGDKLTVTLDDGKSLPGWLSFDTKTRQFVAKEIPDGALPLRVRIRTESETIEITIRDGQSGVARSN